MSKIIPAKERKKEVRARLYNLIIRLEKEGYDHPQIAEIMQCNFKQDVTNAKNPKFAMSEKRANKLSENIDTFLIKKENNLDSNKE